MEAMDDDGVVPTRVRVPRNSASITILNSLELPEVFSTMA